jgi:hypothetical protein
VNKLLSALIVVGLTSLSLADRLITTPMGRKLAEFSLKAELLTIPSRDTVYGWVGYGINSNFEVELYGESLNSSKITPSFNLSYNYISPITDISPGLSIGIVDILGRTADERAAYLAATYFFGNVGDLNQNVPTILTVGGWTRFGGGVFFNVSFPFTEQVRAIGEHDGQALTAGLELQPFAGSSLKFLFREGSPTIGFTFVRRF